MTLAREALLSPVSMKHLRGRTYVFVAGLATTAVLGFLLRYYMWLAWGGLEADYVAWAMDHYFGGIAIAYIEIAERILGGDMAGIGLSYPPAYPAFLAAAQLLGFGDIQHVRILQALLDALAVLPLWYLLRRLDASAPVALFGVLVYATAPWWAMNSTFVMAESLLPAQVACILALMAWTARRPVAGRWFLLGLFGAAISLTRPDMILVAGPLALWALLTSPDRRWFSLAVVLAAFALPLLGWATVNWWLHDQFLLTTRAQAYALWSGLGQVPNDYGYVVSDARAAEHLKSLGMAYHSREAETYWMAEYLRAWREHPEHVLRTVVERIRLILFVGNFGNGPFLTLKILYAAGPYLVLAASTLLVWQRRFAAAFIVAGPLVYAILSLGLVYVEPRYVRYASLSYLMAAVILVQATVGWVSAWRLGRITAASASIIVASLAAWGVWWETVELRETAEDAVVRAVAARHAPTAADAPPHLEFDDLEWQQAVPGAELARDADGSTRLITDSSTYSYQIITEIRLTDAQAIAVNYAVTVEQGQLHLGILSGDGSRFLAQQPLQGPGEAEGRLAARVEGGRVYVVISNGLPSRGRSTARISTLSITKHCADTTDPVSPLLDFLILDYHRSFDRCG